VESLLEPCRPGAGTGQELFDLNDLLGNEVSFLQADAMCRYNVDISMDLSSKILHVRGRRTHFSQVFQNIIHNACEAMAGSKDRHLKISTRMHAQVISIKFADTGPGINSDILPHIFTPFFQAKKRLLMGIQETALALYICKRILEVYQGTICAENKKSGGTLVTISI